MLYISNILCDIVLHYVILRYVVSSWEPWVFPGATPLIKQTGGHASGSPY